MIIMKTLFDRLEQRIRVEEIEERRARLVTSNIYLNDTRPDEHIPSAVSMTPDEQPSEAPMIQETHTDRPEPEEMDEEERGRIGEELRVNANVGDVEELAALLSTDKGRACINERAEDGFTPLHAAAYMSRFEALELLLDMGAEIDPTCRFFGTPLSIAALNGYDSIAELLLSKWASEKMAIETADEYNQALVEGFFVELERVVQNRSVFKIMREELRPR